MPAPGIRISDADLRFGGSTVFAGLDLAVEGGRWTAVLRASGPWHGLAAVEVKRPAPGDPAYLLEINPRMWGFGYLMTLAGLNVPELLVRMLAGREHLVGHIPSTFPPYAPTRMVRTWQDIEIPPTEET